MQEIKSFIHYITHEKRYSVHTIVAYQKDIHQFVDYLNESFGAIDFSLVGLSDIRSWVVALTEQKICESSINRKLISLRSFFKFLLREELINENPASKITLLKSKESIPYFINEKQIDSVQEIESTETLSLLPFEKIRDYVIFEILYCCGLRRSELISLKAKDVQLKRAFIKVIGKRNKERIIPIPEYLIDFLKIYIIKKNEWIVQNGFPVTSFFLINNKGLSITPSFVYRKVNNLLKTVPYLEKKSPHILRHTYATHLLNNGATLGAVKDLLGHTNLTSTQVYTHNSLEQLQRVYKKTHPKAKILN